MVGEVDVNQIKEVNLLDPSGEVGFHLHFNSHWEILSRRADL